MIPGSARATALVGALLAAVLTGPSAGAPSLDVQARAVSLPDLDGSPGTLVVLTVPVSTRAFRFYVTAEFHGGAGAASRDWVMDAASDPGAPGRGEIRHLASFRFGPGKLRGRIRVEDLAGNAAGEARVEAQVPDYGAPGVHLSDLVAGSCAGKEGGAAPAGGDAPWDGTVGDAARRFGDANPDLCVWAQVADADTGDSAPVYRVRTRIRNDRGKTVLETTGTVDRRGGRGTLELRPSIQSLDQGSYVLEVAVSLGESEARGEAPFEIDESRFAPAWDPAEIRDLLSYVATNRERIALEQAPPESLTGFWERFWKRRDPDPATEGNPALAEFLKRVDFATLHFGTLDPGWRTDRGRIYIQYGPPDREEQSGRNASGLPTVLWYYTDRHLTFVFQDSQGFGAYRLVGRRRTKGGL